MLESFYSEDFEKNNLSRVQTKLPRLDEELKAE